jgi:hypothetical protein
VPGTLPGGPISGQAPSSGQTEAAFHHLDPLTKLSHLGFKRSCVVELALNAR